MEKKDERKKICIIAPYSGTKSGGNLVLRKIKNHLNGKNECTMLYAPPYLKVKGYRFLFRLAKYLRYILSGNLFKNKIYFCKTVPDVLFFSWPDDIEYVEEKKICRIVQVVQSDDIWGAEVENVIKVKNKDSIEKVYVAKHLASDNGKDLIVNLFEMLGEINSGSVGKRGQISSFISGAWFKGAYLNDYYSRLLANELNLEYVSFGQGGSSISDRSLPYLKKPDLINILSQSKLFISLSHHEGMPILVLEAIASGTLCVLSDIPAHREIFHNFPERVYLLDRSKKISDLKDEIKIKLNDFENLPQLRSMNEEGYQSFDKILECIL